MSLVVKCLVWDLDGTVWNGTLAEGDQVELKPGVADVIRLLDSRGILQSIASRNDHDQAWPLLEVFGIAEYFVNAQIGWGRKADSVAYIAEGLNFAHAAIAFIDDNPVECAEIAHHLADVRCYDAARALELPRLPEFTPEFVTVDSRRRRELYQQKERRESARAVFEGSDEEFLRSLEMRLTISRATERDLARVEELTVRTSQMNATGTHYSQATLRALLDDPEYEVLVAALSDRFGDDGAVGVILVQKHESVWRLRLLTTSCRVIPQGVGSQLLAWLSNEAFAANVHLLADFRRTGRNRMMEVAYRFAGFTTRDCACMEGLPSPDPSVQVLHLEPGYRRTSGARISADVEGGLLG